MPNPVDLASYTPYLGEIKRLGQKVLFVHGEDLSQHLPTSLQGFYAILNPGKTINWTEGFITGSHDSFEITNKQGIIETIDITESCEHAIDNQTDGKKLLSDIRPRIRDIAELNMSINNMLMSKLSADYPGLIINAENGKFLASADTAIPASDNLKQSTKQTKKVRKSPRRANLDNVNIWIGNIDITQG